MDVFHTKCENCSHEKDHHYKWVRSPDFNNGVDKTLDAGVCEVSDCDCKHFESPKPTQP